MTTQERPVAPPASVLTRAVSAVEPYPYRLWQMQPRGRVGPYYVGWGTAARRNGAARGDDPVAVAERALDAHARYLASRTDAAHAAFFADVERLRALARDDGSFPIPADQWRYGARAGYRSARAQGLAISAFIRAHELRPERHYLDAAIRAAEPMGRTIGEGGVLHRTSGGDTFLEDVAVLPAVHRLDGCIVGCCGLFELQRSAFVPRVQAIVGPTIATLQRRLPLYDTGRWSCETALVTRAGLRHLASSRAHHLHVALLHVFASMTGDPRFEAVARAWSVRAARPKLRRVWIEARGRAVVARRFASEDGFAGARAAF